MDILIVGGTQMVGRDFIELILEQNTNYHLTLANRGKTNKNLFSNIPHINIDRNLSSGCESLAGYFFDIVIDFSCYNINQLVNVLKHVSYNYYVLISTQSVLDKVSLGDPNNWLYEYANNKKQLENYIVVNKSKNFNIVRPCALYGKNDYTNRFYEKDHQFYWTANNQLVTKNKGTIPVRDFSNRLLEYLSSYNLSGINFIHIDGDGVTYV